MRRHFALLCSLALLASVSTAYCDDSRRLLTLDHYVRVHSTAPSIAGQDAQLYVREVVLPATALRGGPGPRGVVLFVHGAGTPAEVAFDTPYQDYSWMAYLARAGFDVFAMDLTGYGRSTRPAALNDPCNATPEQQPQFVPALIPATCAPSRALPITTLASDWHDIDAVVEHLRGLRRVEQVALLAWSQGGPRAGGYAARHPAKVSRLVVLAPAYNRSSPLESPTTLAPNTAPMSAQNQVEFAANWDRQVGCPEQYDPAASAAIWADLVASDPVGATWGPGVRRAPQVPTGGFNQAVVTKLQTPFLMVAAAFDKQVPPERVRELYADLGAKQKVIIELACSSHNAMWEKNRGLLFKASLEWLTEGKVGGVSTGELKLGH